MPKRVNRNSKHFVDNEAINNALIEGLKTYNSQVRCNVCGQEKPIRYASNRKCVNCVSGMAKRRYSKMNPEEREEFNRQKRGQYIPRDQSPRKITLPDIPSLKKPYLPEEPMPSVKKIFRCPHCGSTFTVYKYLDLARIQQAYEDHVENCPQKPKDK
jgi:ribosomal protein L37AE/L43A